MWIISKSHLDFFFFIFAIHSSSTHEKRCQISVRLFSLFRGSIYQQWLCSIAAPNCRTGQSKGRYGKRERSIPVIFITSSLYTITKFLWIDLCCKIGWNISYQMRKLGYFFQDWTKMNITFRDLTTFNPVSTRLCHVSYYHGDKKVSLRQCLIFEQK